MGDGRIWGAPPQPETVFTGPAWCTMEQLFCVRYSLLLSVKREDVCLGRQAGQSFPFYERLGLIVAEES